MLIVMVKKAGQPPQAVRMLQLLEVIRLLGRADVTTITGEMVKRLGVKETEYKRAYRKAIGRDLQTLAEQMILKPERCHPDGSPVAEDEETEPEDINKRERLKNTRLFYSLIDSHICLAGRGILKGADADLLVLQRMADSWQVDHSIDERRGDGILIHVIDRTGLITLHLRKDQIPIVIVVARQPTAKDYKPTTEDFIVDEVQRRCAYLLWSEPSLSRSLGKERLGHAAISWGKDLNTPTIEDLRSTEGTYLSPSKSSEIVQLLEDFVTSSITGKKVSALKLIRERTWRPLQAEKQETVELPAIVRLGKWVAILRSSASKN